VKHTDINDNKQTVKQRNSSKPN